MEVENIVLEAQQSVSLRGSSNQPDGWTDFARLQHPYPRRLNLGRYRLCSYIQKIMKIRPVQNHYIGVIMFFERSGNADFGSFIPFHFPCAEAVA